MFNYGALPQTWAVRLEWPPVPEGSALAETTYQVERGASAAELRTYAANVPGVGANTSRTFASFEPPQTLVSHFVDTEALPGRRYAYRLSEKINGSLTGRRSAIVEGSAAEATPRMPRFPRGSAGPATRRPPPPRSRLGMWDLISISEKRCPESFARWHGQRGAPSTKENRQGDPRHGAVAAARSAAQAR